MISRFAILLALVIAVLPLHSTAVELAPGQQAETIRAALLQAQLALVDDPNAARAAVVAARTAYGGRFAQTLGDVAPEADQRVRAGLAQAEEAIGAGDALALADARAQIWTGLLAGGYGVVEHALLAGDGTTARAWLPLREFRQATRFSRPNTDATVAVEELLAGQLSGEQALLHVHADFLDTYQARLIKSLHALSAADRSRFASRRAEEAALAEGYFAILAPAYEEQRGSAALAEAQAAFADLRSAARGGQPIAEALARVEAALHGFRAAPLTDDEQLRRAGQLRRFLSLVPVEYERGVRNGEVVRDFEIREAITFRDGAAAAFADLETLLEARDAATTARIRELLAELERRLADSSTQRAVAEPAEIEALATEIETLLQGIMPPEWQRQGVAGDFDVISSLLDEMEAAVISGQYDMAESTRLEAYAILETGPEARLTAFAPQYIPAIEGLFWYGQGEHQGLARLIADRAPAEKIRASRIALDAELATAQKALEGQTAPTAVAVNAAVIVFREGLEAVLILASLMGSLRGAARALRRPLWWGAAVAFVATILTWFLARGVLSSLARYGERLEAVVSLIAIGVLLLITNWFFHKVYWTGWLANFHARKRRIIGGAVGQWLGLMTLGVSSIYREGFETVLFLQALVLEAGSAAVMGGIALGLSGTLFVGVLVFALQARLPYKKMLIVTGVMIGAVLLVMVGNTVHALQVVGWMPLHPIRTLTLPYWTGMWFGLYATWEGIALQILAGVFVIGSYVLAEHLQQRRTQAAIRQHQGQTSIAQAAPVEDEQVVFSR